VQNWCEFCRKNVREHTAEALADNALTPPTPEAARVLSAYCQQIMEPLVRLLYS